ncbi:MAG: siderophore-interacting protein [Glaciihabitans sp.]
MLSLVTEDAVRERPTYRPYRVTVAAVRYLSPHFTRVTFAGDDLEHFGTAGLDQRIKVIFPLAGRGMSDFGADDERTVNDGSWYLRWRDLPDEARNPIRTYTIRAVRPGEREIDIDFVAHGDGGPAARWLLTAARGDEIVVVGPDQRSADPRGGIDWHPGSAPRVLLAGDETAAPAICSILETLPAGSTARAFIEVPSSSDALELDLPRGCVVTWLPRDGGANGSALEPAVREWVGRHRDLIRPVVVGTPQPLTDIDVDVDLLWDSPDDSTGSDFYAWLAGEAGAIKALRRFLVTETGIDRKRVAFMGYWRLGKAEGA